MWRLGRYRGKWAAIRGSGGARERHTLGTADRPTAERMLRDLNRPAVERGAVADIWNAYVADNAGKAVLATMQHTAKALSWAMPLEPGEITVEMCRAHTARRRAQGRQDGTIHTELGHLRMVLLWAQKRRLIDHAPHIERPAKPAAKDHYLSRDEVAKLIDAADLPHIRLALVLMITTSARIGALLDLTWDRVDLDRGLIHLRNPDDPTRRKGRATVPVNQTARAALAAAREATISEYVIEWGGRPVRSLKKSLATVSTRAGVHVTPHMLRHSAAVWMAEAGVDDRKIADYLGHGNVQMVRRVYAKFRPDHLRDAAAALELGGVVQLNQREIRK